MANSELKMIERCFPNPYPDYSKDTFRMDDENFKKCVKQLIEKYIQKILRKTHNEDVSKYYDKRADVYVGLSGIAFMFLKISKSSHMRETDWLKFARDYTTAATLAASQQGGGSVKPISLLSGDAGRNFVATAVTKISHQPHLDHLKDSLQGIKMFENPSYLTTEIVTPVQLKQMADVLLKSGRSYSEKHHCGIPLMYQYHGKEYLGAAHGIAAILFALLKLDINESDLNDVKNSIDQLLSLQDDHGNFPSKFYNRENCHLIHWCHGAPGMFYLMAKAYLRFKHDKYLTSCIKMSGLVWKYGLLRKGPGLCHGIAGNGYVHLLLYLLTNDEKYLYRARKFADFLQDESFIRYARTPDRPCSLFEGLSGTVCFLVDLLEPENAGFPFMNLSNLY